MRHQAYAVVFHLMITTNLYTLSTGRVAAQHKTIFSPLKNVTGYKPRPICGWRMLGKFMLRRQYDIMISQILETV